MCSIIGCNKIPENFVRFVSLRFGYCGDCKPYMDKIINKALIFEGRRKHGVMFGMNESKNDKPLNS